MAEQINRQQKKWEAAALLREAQVPPRQMTAFYLLLVLVLDIINAFDFNSILGSFVAVFISILCMLLAIVLKAGLTLYFMAIRRGEHAEFLTVFDGFSMVGKLIALDIVTSFFILLWSMLFVIPGIIASYRYRFAEYNLLENPDLGIMEAIRMSKQQTYGYKSQLFLLDLTYWGWNILSSLPTIILNGYISGHYAFQASVDAAVNYAGLLGPSTVTLYLGIPGIVWVIFQGLWSLVVAMFYLPQFRCVDLAYFETAKRTSRIGTNVPPPEDDGYGGYGGWKGPDGLGGL
ncbi:MAG: DUF975 family protein [Oscillibacter sp.]|nr:DUF975 family protein [Oscillibacter sp.]MCI9481315.1 DUF975 family protein [Oscillibacter sp.]